MSAIVTGPISRTQQSLRFEDGRSGVRCFGPHNPQYYATPSGRLLHIDPASILDTASTIGQILKREKNVVSVGMRKADNAFKYLGLRPDFDQANGNQQLEFSLQSIELDGKSQSIRFDRQAAVDPVTMDRGSLIIQSTRQRTRQMVRATNKISDFRITFELHLKGLNILEIPDLGEFWIFDQNGNFRFRIVQPRIIDPVNLQPVTDQDGRPLNFVQHRLEQAPNGKVFYIKEPAPGFNPAALPADFFIDADTYYSSTADGYIYNSHIDWSAVRNAVAGSGISSTVSSISNGMWGWFKSATSEYWVVRSFFYFNTTGIGSPASGTINIHGYNNGVAGVTIQKGSQSDTLVTADYDAFSGSLWGSVDTWTTSAYNAITLNAAGLTEIVNGITKVCARDKSYDYQDSPPGTAYGSGCYYSDNSGADKDPYLEIQIDPEANVTIALSGGGTIAFTQDTVRHLVESLSSNGNIILQHDGAHHTALSLGGSGSFSIISGKEAYQDIRISGHGNLALKAEKRILADINLAGGGQIIVDFTTYRLTGLTVSGDGAIIPVINTERQPLINLSGHGDTIIAAAKEALGNLQLSGRGQVGLSLATVHNTTLGISENGQIILFVQPAKNTALTLSGGGQVFLAVLSGTPVEKVIALIAQVDREKSLQALIEAQHNLEAQLRQTLELISNIRK